MNSLEKHQANRGTLPEDAEADGSSLAADTLSGAQAIADFIGTTRRQAYHKCEKGLIPAGKLGKIWIGSKRKITKHFSDVTSGSVK